MKITQLLALAGISMLAMSNSCQKEDLTPELPVTTARVVKAEVTVDSDSRNPRTRWIINIAPLELPGWSGRPYQQARVFNLPDTVSYKAGTLFSFRYKLVPEAEQTPWKTLYEWNAVPAPTQPLGATAFPELVLSDIKPNSSR